MKEMLKGKIVMNVSMIGIKIIHDTKSEECFFKLAMKDLASQVIDEDIVECTIQNNQGVVHKIIERRRQPFIGVVSKITSKVVYLHLPLMNPCSSIPYLFHSNQNIKIGDYVVGWIGGPESKNQLEITQVIESQTITYDLERVVKRYHEELFQLDHSDLLFEFKSLPHHPIKDLTHLDTFHIDPSGCTDIDDLMSIDLSLNKIYIHIIDISKYISLGSKDDRIGLSYGNTWYLPNFSIHLFQNISEIYNNPLFCITMEISFDNGQITDVQLYKSKVNLKYDLIYSDVQDIFDGKNHPLKLSLDWSLGRIGSIYIPNENPMRKLYWKIDQNKINIEYENELLAHRYINAWMVFYNSWIAENVKIQNQTLPQRHHPETKPHKEFMNISLPIEVQHIMYMKQMRQAEYMNKPGHFGLNKGFYTHATSPLRRYFDRWIQYMYTYDLWIPGEKLLEHLNRMERISERVSDWVHKQILFQYVEQNKNKLWEAYVVKIHPKGIEWYLYELQEFLYEPKSDPFIILGEKAFLKIQVDRRNIPRLQIV